ncbi:hypothetical protein [Effusibacillus pohliae]|uniref:hypothetical protein n=1 Tax=Effusibacillus pohliae TaxID=232270 RepID=UPI00037D71A7|nr:hypothetical protein [Effusibacillus pohliae]
MRLILLTLLAVVCVIVGDWLLRKGVAFQVRQVRRGIWLQILAALVTFGLPIAAAYLAK